MILNLTQHEPTSEQYDVVNWNHELVKELITFDDIPTKEEMVERANQIACIAVSFFLNNPQAGDYFSAPVMIGGAPFFMGVLESVLKENGLHPLYSFSKRVSMDAYIDGKIVKKSEFKHIGWVRV